MAAGDGSIQTAAEQWSSLPDDLLGMVYVRLAFPVDRVRFAAVCASWRAFASAHPPSPVLPWLMLDPRGGDETKRVYCPDDGTVLPRVPISRSEAAAGCFVGGYDGGWLASSEAPLGIVNLFSGAEVAFSTEQRRTIRAQQCSGDLLVMRKVVFSEVPTSRGCILAAITDKHGLALCRVGCPEVGWTARGFHREERLVDIAFYNGELYGLMRYRDWLVKFEIGVNEDGYSPVLTAVHRLAIENPYPIGDPGTRVRYIVELRGKLVMVVRRLYWWGPSIELLELVDGDGDRSMDTHTYRWVNMPSLGDHALFLGPTCSKAVHVPEGGHGGVKSNHVYCSHHRCLRRDDEIPDGAKVFLTSSIDDGDRVYYREENCAIGGDERITLVEYYVKGGVLPPVWILPPNI